MIRGITFSEQMFYSADFAHFQHFWLNGKSGITKGCNITQDGSQVTIGKGYFIVHGRLMNVEVAEVIGSAYGYETGYNRIVYEIDLSKNNTVTEFNQGSIKVLHSAALTQQDLDNDGTVYQYPLCHFQWSGSSIASFVVDAGELDWENAFASLEANFETYETDFQTWVTAQKNALQTWVTAQEATINQMIADLQSEGFAKTVAYTATIPITGWTQMSGGTSGNSYSYYRKELTVSGILASDNPIVDVVTSSVPSTAEEQLSSWGNIYKILTQANQLVLIASEIPEVSIPIQIKVVR